MNSALVPGSLYFLILFAFGFMLGTLRVLFVAPWIGAPAAVLVELPIMLAVAYFVCRQVIRRFQVPSNPAIRWAMVVWFLALLFVFETGLGALLFGRTLAEQWSALQTPSGLLGVSAQIIAALLPVWVGKRRLS